MVYNFHLSKFPAIGMQFGPLFRGYPHKLGYRVSELVTGYVCKTNITMIANKFVVKVTL